MNLADKYSRDSYIDFISKFIPDFSRDIRDVTNTCSNFKKIRSIGESRNLDLQILEIEVVGNLDRRISIATDAFKMMKGIASFRALVAFHSSTTSEWRLSLMTAQPTLSDGKVVVKLSNPRRYSYILGPEAKIKTPSRFLLSAEVEDFEDLLSRFSIEVVNKEFYQEVARFFYELIGGQVRISTKQEDHKRILRLPFVDVDSNRMYQEFAIRLIGRIIFCWFLKQKKSAEGIPLLPESLLSSKTVESNPDYYHTVLEKIFFEALNKEIDNRNSDLSDDFKLIPFLNGGLFDPHHEDFYEGFANKSLVIPDDWFKEFFTVLETYNFTIDENTIADVDLSVDPEMLGRIFENLLAEINPETGESARKSTGSYYTPREIVEHMVDQSLINYLSTKTKIAGDKIAALVSYDEEDDKEKPLNRKEISSIIEALDQIRIIDPACGSGAFPIGILQKIIMMLQRIDPKAKLWFEKKIESLDLLIREDFIKRFESENFNYIRKSGIIRDSIYGVDIQPIAVEVSKLRCFLTLVVDEEIDERAINRGIEPLPNLEFKFMAANTLIELPEANTPQTGLFEDHAEIKMLRSVRDAYFKSSGIQKEKLKTEFYRIKNQMSQSQIKKAGQGILTMALAEWDPFSQKSSTWFDPEWMLGISGGFDIVIGNPPYVDSEMMTRLDDGMREKYAEAYSSARGNWDLFIIFIERGLKLLNSDGVITYIVPNKLIAARYSESIRKLLSELNIKELRNYSGVKVFKDVSVYPIVFVIQNNKDLTDVTMTNMKTVTEIKEVNSIPADIFYQDIYWDRYFAANNILNVIIKISKEARIKEYDFDVSAAATVSEAYKIKEFMREKDTDITKGYKKFINTGTIDRYVSLWSRKKTQYIKGGYQEPIVLDKDINDLSHNRYKQACSEKIIIGGMTKELECQYDDGQYLAGKSTVIITERQGTKLELKYLLALLNSELISFWFKIFYGSLSLAGGYLRISNKEIMNIPIPDVAQKTRDQLIELVDRILSLTSDIELLEEESNQDRLKDLQNEIDLIVYKLYGLTKEEIALVENKQ